MSNGSVMQFHTNARLYYAVLHDDIVYAIRLPRHTGIVLKLAYQITQTTGSLKFPIQFGHGYWQTLRYLWRMRVAL